MLFESRFWPLIADGSLTLTFRRWRRRQAKVGGHYRTPGGIIVVDAVDTVDAADIEDVEAECSGYPSAQALVSDLRGSADLPVYRIVFHRAAGRDPRAELAEADGLTADELAELHRKTARLDRASSQGPWTTATLEAIASHPGVRSTELAAELGRKRPAFKADVRKLKNLGLTMSLKVGYQLSPRGAAYLRRDQPGAISGGS